MSRRDLDVDLCVIGAGAAGLSVAAGAVQLGLSVVLFEKGEMGGECLNVGCVPSKALIECARRAHQVRDAARFGVDVPAPAVNWANVQAHVRAAIAAIEPNDSQQRFEGLGCTVIRETARFTGPRSLESASARVRARRFVIATGSRPAVPPIPGLDAIPFLTNESVFTIPALPKRLLVLGGGAIGAELGQAFRRLGAEVAIVEAAELLGAADSEARDLVAAQLRAEGVELHERTRAIAAAREGEGVALTLQGAGGAERRLAGSHLLVAAGRAHVFDDLGLDAADVAHGPKGVAVTATLRSVSNPRVWAVGDANGLSHLTHAAGWHASVWVRNVLFKARTRHDAQAMPRVVFCDPELAEIGVSETEARARWGEAAKLTRWSYAENDRAHAAGDTRGLCKLIADPKGVLAGAVIVGAEAGELIATLGLAIARKLTLRALTEPVIAYPTRAEIVKRAASAAFTPILFSASTRALVNLLKRIP